MNEIRRCPVTGRFRAKGLNRSLGKSPEERSATGHARAITGVLTLGFVALLSVHVSDQMTRLQQQAAALQIPSIPADSRLPLLQVEPGWEILSMPDSSWVIQVKPEDKPVKKEKPIQRKKPEPIKPVKKVEKVKAVSGAKANASEKTGAAKTIDTSAIVLSEIIDQIERHKHYPDRAKSQGIEGRILLEVSLGSDGTVREVGLKKGGHPLLRRATLQAAKHLKAMKTQAKQAMVLVVPVTYEIH